MPLPRAAFTKILRPVIKNGLVFYECRLHAGDGKGDQQVEKAISTQAIDPRDVAHFEYVNKHCRPAMFECLHDPQLGKPSAESVRSFPSFDHSFTR